MLTFLLFKGDNNKIIQFNDESAANDFKLTRPRSARWRNFMTCTAHILSRFPFQDAWLKQRNAITNVKILLTCLWTIHFPDLLFTPLHKTKYLNSSVGWNILFTFVSFRLHIESVQKRYPDSLWRKAYAWKVCRRISFFFLLRWLINYNVRVSRDSMSTRVIAGLLGTKAVFRELV